MSTRHKQKADSQLGHTVINARGAQRRSRQKKRGAPAALGDEDAPQIIEQIRPVVESIVEESSVQEFMARAQLADMRFTADRDSAHIVNQRPNELVAYKIAMQEKNGAELQLQYGDRLKIPRRPPPTTWSNTEELHRAENANFLEWRRALAELELMDHVALTPFERNLEMWRQLWRVIERSHVIVQIVDARNPLLFRNRDLESYIHEVDPKKRHILLINKADLLSSEQRALWADYFEKQSIEAWFWSAVVEENEEHMDDIPEEEMDESDSQTRSNSEASSDDEYSGSDSDSPHHNPKITSANVKENLAPSMNGSKDAHSLLIGRDELVDRLKSLATEELFGEMDRGKPMVVGMVGYPNVGKSSTINKLMGTKKVAVSATPGKTKHLQTLIIDEQLTLCDCPGLVMPSLAMSKAEMLINGILPIDQLHDPHPACSLVCAKLPRRHLEYAYGVMLPPPADHEPADRPPTSAELLTSVAFVRGFMSSKGIPDQSRAARFVLKSVVDGRVVVPVAPPGFDSEKYCAYNRPQLATMCTSTTAAATLLQQLNKRNLLETDRAAADKLDSEFFDAGHNAAHIRGKKPGVGKITGKHHQNRGKKEKTRRLFKHLDA